MKIYKSLLIIATTMLTGLWVAGCSDEATLENSKEVYIDITPDNISMAVGDTVPISATVMNTEGKLINTPVYWSLDDESVVKLLGDTALTCVVGSLDRGTTAQYSTKLRCTLPGNKKYAIVTVAVTPTVPDGITPDAETYTSYNIQQDEVWFTVSPKSLLDDYVPVVELSNDQITLCDPAIIIEKETGRVGVCFDSGQEGGECVITLSIGEGATAVSGSCTIIMQPFVEVSLWDDGHGTGINDQEIPRMKQGELEQYRTFTLTKTIDLNSESYAYAGVNLPGGVEKEIRQAMELSHWEAVSGNSVLVTEMRNDFLENLGFDAILNVRSGAIEGTTVFNFVSPDTVATFEVTFRVIDFKKQAVDQISTNAPEGGVEMKVGDIFELETGVIPASSYLYHKPVVTANDPTIVSVGEYDGSVIKLTGLKVGSTSLVLTANDKTLEVPVTVTEGVSRIILSSSNATAAFVGQTITWEANVVTTSGNPSTFPIEWSSSDETVATVVQGADATTTGSITANAAGTVNISATVLGTTGTAALTVLSVPGDLAYTAANTTRVSIKAESSSSKNQLIQFTGDGEQVQILLSGYKNQYEFDITDMSVVSVTYAGVQLTPQSGWIKGTDTGDTTIFSFSFTFNIGGKTFTMTATDLEG